MPRNYLVQIRRDASSTWTSTNPVLQSGEIGYEVNTGKMKVGDGSSTWSSLRYLADILNDNGVLPRMLRDSAGTSVLGRPVNSVGDPSDIRALTDGWILQRNSNQLIFARVGRGSFADGAVTSAKILDGTLKDIKFSTDADISPSKLGPGYLPTDIMATTVNYVEQSITVDKLNRTKTDEGIAVWLNYDPRCYQVTLREFSFELNIGGINPNTGIFGYWPVAGNYQIGVPMEYTPGSLSWGDLQGGITRSQSYNKLYGGKFGSLFGPLRGVAKSPSRHGEVTTQSSDENAFTGDQAEREFRGIEKVYAKFAVINNTCYVSVLVNFTQETERRTALNFTLPFLPEAPETTIVGSAYHLISASTPEPGRRWRRDNNISNRLQPIVPVISKTGTISFFTYLNSESSSRDPFGDLGTKAYYYGRFRSPDRLSFNVKYEIRNT